MSRAVKLRDWPGRIAAGAFILDSGLRKRTADDETAAGLHGFAAGTYPFLADVEPRLFVRGLAYGEIALGAALLAPVVPTAVVGLALSAFGGGLLGLYARTPGMHEGGRPTRQGTPIAKDAWLVGIGVGLLVDAVGRRR